MIRSTVLAAVLVPTLLQAQARDTARAAPIITTATRAPVSLNLLPASVTVLMGSDLRLRGITTVSDALATLPSAYVAQTGSQGGTTSLFLRGGESKYVKVLIDGVPVNDPGGVYDFASLTTDNVERIEIVRGPVSVIHGADAVTGVVQIFTRRGAGTQNAESSVNVGTAPRTAGTGPQASPGSATNIDASTSLSGALPNASYSVALARHLSDGLYKLNNHYRNDVFSARFTFSPQAGWDVRASVRYTDYRYNYPTNGPGDIRDSNAFRGEDRTSVGVEVERGLGAKARTVLAVTSSINDGGTDDGPDAAGTSAVSQDKVRRRGIEWRLQVQPTTNVTATLSAQLEQQDQHSQYQSQDAFFGPFSSLFSAARRNLGAAGEVMLAPSDRFTTTLGVRVDDNERFGVFTTARAGASARVLAHTRVRGTIGNAFREPTFFENYAFGLGNPTLDPETSRSAEVAVEQGIDGERVTLSAIAFGQRFENMIDYSGANACGYSYCNVTEATSNGLELEVRGTVTGPLSAAVSGTLLETEVITPGYDVSAGGQYHKGDALIRRPAVKWVGEATWRDARPLSGSLRIMRVGSRGDRDFHFPSTPVTLAAYTRVDIGAAYALRPMGGRSATLTLRVENLLDEDYQSVFNFLAPRRTVTGGARLSF